MMEAEMTPLEPGAGFCFKCTPGVPCFNECCRDLSQYLTPYDILRLKNCLGLFSGEFLEQYTVRYVGPETGLPVIALKPNPSTEQECPFVRPAGCAVYADRPSSCRMYPLARAVSRARDTGALTEHYALLREPHCQGFSDGEHLSVDVWLDQQGLKGYNAMNDHLMILISLKNRLLPGPLEPRQAERFHLALYDLDRFRQAVFEQDLLTGLKVPAGILDKARTDDVELLKLGLDWIRFKLFGNAE
jgi:Fe-S-cluster containining protein